MIIKLVTAGCSSMTASICRIHLLDCSNTGIHPSVLFPQLQLYHRLALVQLYSSSSCARGFLILSPDALVRGGVKSGRVAADN